MYLYQATVYWLHFDAVLAVGKVRSGSTAGYDAHCSSASNPELRDLLQQRQCAWHAAVDCLDHATHLDNGYAAIHHECECLLLEAFPSAGMLLQLKAYAVSGSWHVPLSALCCGCCRKFRAQKSSATRSLCLQNCYPVCMQLFRCQVTSCRAHLTYLWAS